MNALNNAISYRTAEGWRILTQNETQAVLEKGGNVNHTVHLILSIISCGLWLLVWPVVWFLNRRQSLVLRYDPATDMVTEQRSS